MDPSQKGIPTSIPSFLTITLDEIAAGLDSGFFTVQDLTQTALTRIGEVQDTLHAVIELNSNALAIARLLDDELKASGRRRGPLFGAPILIKDNIFVAEDNLRSSSGSSVLLGTRPPRESPVVSRLREAGAVILGSANLSEWANFRSKVSNSGWSQRGGQTLGAYHHKMNPSGSSSGSAVAADVGLCLAAIGTETWGSLIYPADANNVVALKPTLGLVSRDATIPVSLEKDTPGPVARTFKDAAAILGIIAGSDPNDPATYSIPFDEIPDYTKSCTMADVSKFKIGIPRNTMSGVPGHVQKEFDRAVQGLRDLGVEVIDIDFAGFEESAKLEFDEQLWVMATEFRVSINKYLAELEENPRNIRSLEDIIELTKNGPEEDYPHRDMILWELALKTSRVGERYTRAKEREERFAGPEGILGAMEAHGLDAIITPNCAKTCSYFAAGGGLPMIGVPLGYAPDDTPVKWSDRNDTVDEAPNRPYGLGIVGKAFSEEVLVKVAFAVESVTQTRKRAKHLVLPNTDLDDVVGEIVGR
ncbi:amidase signature domain-containing protein [Podospora aff. communis PSN243]|uniref:Amidase signature domain-containing protein n=1 Tax=Podospora aff. communis PSN243 TaxID=3040156 RepID=A0AAV9GN61_9PEZI|nr:amidase signature domain-containing protein [Podospora aff. communis PSN243]